MRIAFLDTFSGISGDMTVGALLDAGTPIESIRDAVGRLALDGVEIWSEKVDRYAIAATKFHVRVHGRHPDEPHHQHHHHAHRPYREIRDRLAASALDAVVRDRALAVFAKLAEAEGRAHGVATEDVEFHEVGALDAIVDVVGAAVGFTHLGIDAIFHGPLPLGTGFVDTAHGRLPVPGPAVTELVRGRRVRAGDGTTELVTPTGAAIVAALARAADAPEMTVETVGYGAGDRVLADRPNLLRIAIGRTVAAATSADDVVVLEATIDDSAPELFEHVIDRLLAAGAKDVFLVPVVMKKSRPAVMLRVLGAPSDRDRLASIVFAETTTIGLRYTTWSRLVLPREETTVETPWGAVRVKIAVAPDGTRNVAPEYEDCRRVALDRQVPLKLVLQAALAAAIRR
jgi:uncharacterized protein (TIGR00299 family) protein